MTSSSNSRRYLVPGLFLVAVAASYAIGYLSNSGPDLTTGQSTAADALATPANPNGPGGLGSLANRVGGKFGDDGSGSGALTVAQVTGGLPLEEWIKKLMAQEDEVYRLKNFMRLYDALNTPDDIKAALKAFRESEGRGRGGGRMESSMLLQKFAMLDPNAAIAFAAELRGGDRMMATGTVLRTWAKTSPDAALAWAKANGAPKAGEEGQGQGRGPGGPGGPERIGNWSVASVISQIAKNDIDKALTEASTTKDRTVGRTADSLAGELIQQRGAEAALKAAAALPAGDFKNELIQELTGKLAAQDPKGAATWANSLAAGETKSRALREAVQQWTRKDVAAAGAFVSALPVVADSDAARSQFAVSVAVKDQNTALATIKGITDPGSQKRTVGQIAGSIAIAQRNVAAGQQFVAQTSIDDQAKADITRMLTRQQRGPGGQGGQGRQGATGGGGGGGGSGRGGQGGGRGGR